MGWIFVAVLLLALAGLAAHLVAVARFQAAAAALRARIEGSQGSDAGQRLGRSDLPLIVRDFARRAGVRDSPPAAMRLSQRCEMRFTPEGAWKPLTAHHVAAVREAAFVWLAEQRLGPLVTIRVVDAYVGGRGLLDARLLGSIPVARASGPEADRGEMMRYLAELPWVPDALLHNPSLRFRELSENAVEVSAETSGGTALVRLFFEDGDLVRAEADDRPRMEGSRTVGLPWEGRFWAYREVGGRRIPTRGEVSWILDEGPFAYWRGEILAYEALPENPPTL